MIDSANDFTREHTQIAKGVAICLMLIHHLFSYYNRIPSNSYISFFTYKGINIETILGNFGNICVTMYLFLSGYGQYFKAARKDNFSFHNSALSLGKLILNYVIVFFLFVPIGFIFFNVPFNLKDFLLNLFCLKYTYNSEWWFLPVYVELVFLLPLIMKIYRGNFIAQSFKSLFILLFGLAGRFFIYNYLWDYGISRILLYNIAKLLIWQFPFVFGYLCAKFNLYKTIKMHLQKLHLDNILFYLLLTIVLVSIRVFIPGGRYKDPGIVPFFIFCIVNIICYLHLQRIFVFLGKHSTNMWLVHSFFCYTYFRIQVYEPRYSVFIFLKLLILSLVASYIICLIYKGIFKLIKKNRR